MNDNKLGDVLLQQKLIDRRQLEQALAEQKQNPERLLGHILVENGALRYASLVTAIVEHQHMPLARALLQRREQLNQPLDEHGIPLLRVSEEDARKLDLPEDAFPVPIPTPDLAHFSVQSETEQELAEDAFNTVKNGEIEEARQIITQGLTILPDSSTMHYLVAWLLSMDGKVGDSVGKIERSLPDFRNNASVLWLMAYNLQYMNKHREAVEHYQRLLRRETPQREWYFAIAYSMDCLKYWAKARQTYTHFIRITQGETQYTWFARQRLREIIEHHDTD